MLWWLRVALPVGVAAGRVQASATVQRLGYCRRRWYAFRLVLHATRSSELCTRAKSAICDFLVQYEMNWHFILYFAASCRQSADAAGGKSSVGMATDAVEDFEDVEDQITKKYGIGGINQPIGKQNRQFTYCPLHIAAQKCNIVSTWYCRITLLNISLLCLLLNWVVNSDWNVLLLTWKNVNWLSSCVFVQLRCCFCNSLCHITYFTAI